MHVSTRTYLPRRYEVKILTIHIYPSGPSLRRVLVASSVASISGTRAGSSDPNAVSKGASSVYKETDWNTHDVAEVERKGDDANPVVMYCAAKTLGEKGEW